LSTLAQAIGSGVAASRPAAGIAGRLYFATDTGKIFWDNAAAWVDVTPPSGGGGAAAALVLLEEHSASNSAELDFTAWYSSTYDLYQIEIVNLIPVTTNTNVLLQFSTNGGSSYDGSSIYSWQSTIWVNNGQAQDGYANQAYITLNGNGIGSRPMSNNVAYGGLVGSYKLYNPGSTASYKLLHGEADTYNTGAGQFMGLVLGAQYMSVAAVNAFRIYISSGNISSGTVRAFGLTH